MYIGSTLYPSMQAADAWPDRSARRRPDQRHRQERPAGEDLLDGLRLLLV